MRSPHRRGQSLAAPLFSTITLLLLLAAAPHPVGAMTDPVTQDHPLWTLYPGSAAVDGVMAEAEWDQSFLIRRAQPWWDGAVTVRAMYDAQGLYLGLEAEDAYLSADGNGGGAGNRWEVESDDSITFYFDPNESRDEWFQSSDRAFGVNLGNPLDPINGSGVVRRWKYVQGNGAGLAPDVLPGGDPAAGIRWATVVRGTVNAHSDQDQGWTTEIFLPWSALNRAAPTHGDTMGMTFDLIFDNAGGPRDFTDYRHHPDRFKLPAFIDDHLQGTHSSFHASLGGLRGPVSYARVLFFDPAATTQPAAVNDLTLSSPSAHGAILNFTAPAGLADGRGQAARYQIRYALTPITSAAAWSAATELPNAYVPRPKGAAERLRLIGLAPETNYHVVVRAVDAAGRLGPLSNSAPFRTSAASAGRGRIVPAPGGPYLTYEDGTPFVPVGEHLGVSWAYFRNLFPGDIWDPVNKKFQNYRTTPSYEGQVGPYLDELSALGVNTLRVFLEVLGLDQTGNTARPRGRYWLEFPAGTFNPDARQFVLTLLEEAAKRDMYLIFSPFDTFVWNDVKPWGSVFTDETPWYVGNGGPLTDINDFFQNPQTLEMAKTRMRRVIDWVAESPHAHHLIGWETLNEWDSYEWTLNAEGAGEPGRESEMRRRVQWIQALNAEVRARDPHRLIISSTTARDPRGPVARLLFYDRSFDLLAPHYYTTGSEEPFNNTLDSDRSVRPALEIGRLTAYWSTHREHVSPLINAEWGLNRALWPGPGGVPSYGPTLSKEDDEDIYRTLSWSGLANGQAGQGLRISSEEAEPNCHALTDGSDELPVSCPSDDGIDPPGGATVGVASMRDVQRTLSRYMADPELGIGLTDPDARPLLTRMRARSASKTLRAWGYGGAETGLGYVLLDGNLSNGPVAGARLEISGLDSGSAYALELWSTTGGATAPIATRVDQIVRGGLLAVELPTFASDLAVKYRRTAAPVSLALDAGGSGSASGDLPAGGLDSWTLRAVHGTTMRVAVAVGSGLSLLVYDAQGNLLASGSGATPLVFAVTAGARYFVIVEKTGAGSYRLDVTNPAPVGPVNELAAAPGGYVNAAASHAGVVVAATLNADKRVVVFIDENGHTSWRGQVLGTEVPGPTPSGMPVAFVDPKDSLIYVAYPSASGLMLYRRESTGAWTLRNLTTELGGDATTVSKRLTWLVAPPAGGEYGVPEVDADLISLVGMNPANQLVKYAQRRIGGVPTWTFVNLTTRDLTPRVQPAPDWTDEPVGYTTPWNGQNVAGLNAFGEVVVAWSGGPDGVWSVSKLADFAPTPGLAGGLSAFVNWGINLTGILPDGRLGVTWWSAQYEREQKAAGSDQIWAFNILSDPPTLGLRPRLAGESVVGLTTPNWVSNSVYGIAAGSGHLVAYWWSPGVAWNSADLNERVSGSDVPTGKLSGVAARDSTISVFGVNARGEVLRFFWTPDSWRFENLSTLLAP